MRFTGRMFDQNGGARHVDRMLLRFVVAVPMSTALFLGAYLWGDYTGMDGQEVVASWVLMFAVGVGIAAAYMLVGTVSQVLLRHKPARTTVVVDLALGAVLVLGLLIGGSTARVVDNASPPGHAATRHR